MKYTVDDLVMKLAATHTAGRLFNPYNEIDKICDQNTAPGLRQNNLRIYLNKYHCDSVNEMWITEYIDSTTKLSGVPLVAPMNFIHMQKLLGLSEILEIPIKNTYVNDTNVQTRDVWNQVSNYNELPLIWSVLPFYPYESSVQQPREAIQDQEFLEYASFLEMLISIYKPKKIYTLSKQAKKALQLLDVKSTLRTTS